jgi:zinc transporter ZupT
MELSGVLFGLMASVVLGGGLVTYLSATNKNQWIKLLLAFSGGFLLAIIFQHLLPDLYHDGDNSMGIYILYGFLIQLILEYFSGGIEHGHVHVHGKQQLPWLLFLSLSIHSVIEGIPLGNHFAGIESDGHHQHETLFWGIIFHQIPVAVALMTLLINTGMKTLINWLVLLMFGIMTPFGVLLGLSISPEQIGIDVHMVLAIVVGMFLHISTTIIFETTENHKFNLLKLLSIIIGVSLAMAMY